MEAKTKLADFFRAEPSVQFQILFKDGELFIMRSISSALLNIEGVLCGTIVEVVKTIKKHPLKPEGMMDFEFKDIAEVTNLQTKQLIKFN